MNVQYTQRKRQTSDPRRRLRIGLLALGIAVLLFVVANIVMGFMYRGRVLPNYSLGNAPVGGISFDELDGEVAADKVLPKTITLQKDDTKQEYGPEEFGVQVDWPATKEQLKNHRSWLPLLSLFVSRTVPVELTVNTEQFDATTKDVASQFKKDALPERVAFAGADFVIAKPEGGYRLDEAQFKPQLLDALEKGNTELAVPTAVTTDNQSGADLNGELAKLQKQLKTKITFSVNGQPKQASAADIGGWFAPSGQTMVFSQEKAREFVGSLAASVYNASDGAAAASYALDKGQDTTFVVATDQTPVRYSYCASGKGVDQAHLPGFIAKVAAVLGDPRGWSANGKVAFARAETGCDFTIWLSAPAQMTSFGGVCDPYYSCRSGRNVVVNFDRWQGATPPWNAAGGNLEDYRVMVTNHEVGHWLGFGHLSCPGPGQPAPVMMQQSIDLGGCTFNPWPVASEINTLKHNKGVALRPRDDLIASQPCCCAHCTNS